LLVFSNSRGDAEQAFSAIIHPDVPVAWAACVMSQGKNNDSHVIGAIHKRKWKVLQEHSSHTR
jgi:hypothetical protein